MQNWAVLVRSSWNEPFPPSWLLQQQNNHHLGEMINLGLRPVMTARHGMEKMTSIGLSCSRGAGWWWYKVTHHIWLLYWLIRSHPKSKGTFPNLSLWVSSVLWKENLFRGNLPSPQLSTWKYFLPVLMHNKLLIRRG